MNWLSFQGGTIRIAGLTLITLFVKLGQFNNNPIKKICVSEFYEFQYSGLKQAPELSLI